MRCDTRFCLLLHIRENLKNYLIFRLKLFTFFGVCDIIAVDFFSKGLFGTFGKLNEFELHWACGQCFRQPNQLKNPVQLEEYLFYERKSKYA